jgi:hypothetical protein
MLGPNARVTVPHSSPKGLLIGCSFCGENIVEGRIDVLEFRFHQTCAENVAMVLSQAKAYATWKSVHPQNPGFDLVA